MHEYKEKQVLSRSDIAARLRKIADGVENGSMVAGETQISLPSQAEFELEVEKNEVEIKIDWH